jgi:hypothetical protein
MVAQERREEAAVASFTNTRQEILDKLLEAKGYIEHGLALELLDDVGELLKARSKPKPAGLRGVLEALEDVGTVVDSAFPGYAQAGPAVRELLLEAAKLYDAKEENQQAIRTEQD